MSGSWPEVTLMQVADLVRGVSYPKEDSRDDPAPKYVPVLRATNIQDSRLILDGDLVYVAESNVAPEQLLRPGDIVVATSSGSKHLVGKSAHLSTHWDGSFGAFCAGLRPKPNIESRYLAYFLQSPRYWKEIGKKALGVNINNLRRGDLESLSLPLPPPAVQAQVIAEIEKQFSRLDEAVANLQRVKANLRRYVARVRNDAAAGRLLPRDSGDTPSEDWLPAERSSSPGATPLPAGWTWVTCGDVIDDIEAGASFKCQERPPLAGEIGVLKVSAVTWGRYDEDESKTCLDPSRMREDLMVRPGDFLFSRANTIDLVGACVIVGAVVSKCLMLSDKTLRFRLSSKVAPGWLLNLLRSGFGRSEIERLATGNQESMRNIGQERIRQIRLPLPPLEEQHRIVAEVDRRLSIVRGVEAEVEANLKRAQALRQAVLQRAFTDRSAVEVRTTATRPALRLIPGTGSAIETARVALSAEIIHRLHAEPHFGRVKLQKIIHLCEYNAELELVQGHYIRAAAGPLDLPMIEASERNMKALGWYAERPRTGGSGHEYHALSKAGEHKPYLACFTDEQLQVVHKLIDLMRDWDTARCEMFSTVYAAWNDLLLFGTEATPEAIASEILERWNDAKLKFTRHDWLKQIEWVRQHGFVPKGFGRSTRGQTDGLTPDLFDSKSR